MLHQKLIVRVRFLHYLNLQVCVIERALDATLDSHALRGCDQVRNPVLRLILQ